MELNCELLFWSNWSFLLELFCDFRAEGLVFLFVGVCVDLLRVLDYWRLIEYLLTLVIYLFLFSVVFVILCRFKLIIHFFFINLALFYLQKLISFNFLSVLWIDFLSQFILIVFLRFNSQARRVQSLIVLRVKHSLIIKFIVNLISLRLGNWLIKRFLLSLELGITFRVKTWSLLWKNAAVLLSQVTLFLIAVPELILYLLNLLVYFRSNIWLNLSLDWFYFLYLWNLSTCPWKRLLMCVA